MAAFGRDTWEASGEGSRSYRFLALIAPLHSIRRRIRLRWPLTGLAGAERVPGSVAFVAVMLGSVLFDGYSRTTTWQDLISRVEAPYVVDHPTLGELLVTLLNLGGLLAGVLLVAFAYETACAVARWTVNAPRSLTPDFIRSLVPIAFVYMLAHYFTLFVLQGQFVVPLSPTRSAADGTCWYRPRRAEPHRGIARHDLVRAGRRARRRSCRGPGGRPRPCDHDVPGATRDAELAVRAARSDGALHGRGLWVLSRG
jgi:hypothetical protein